MEHKIGGKAGDTAGKVEIHPGGLIRQRLEAFQGFTWGTEGRREAGREVRGEK